MADDGKARTASRFDGRFEVSVALPELPFIADLKADVFGHHVGVEGVSGAPSIAYTSPLGFDWADWALVVEPDRDEELADLVAVRNRLVVLGGIGLVLALGLGLLAARTITRPLAAFVALMNRIADSDYAETVAVADRLDEIGHLGRTLTAFRDRLAASDALAARREADRLVQERVVTDLSAAIQTLAAGDLTRTLDTPFPPDYERLRADFNATVATLRELMAAVVDNAAEIRTRAEEINAASDDLSRRTENQAAMLEDTAAALDELTGSVRAAAEVERIVRTAQADAETSSQVVAEAVEAMARAGDAGRGFAVVASEVRALAQSSSGAAREIKQLILDSAGNVASGVDLVHRTGRALGDMVARVATISAHVGEIASGAREQSVGLSEITVGVIELDKVTQQNAALVEEATAASMTLRQKAESLRRQVGRFRLGREAAHGAAPLPGIRSGRAGPHALASSGMARRAVAGGGWQEV